MGIFDDRPWEISLTGVLGGGGEAFLSLSLSFVGGRSLWKPDGSNTSGRTEGKKGRAIMSPKATMLSLTLIEGKLRKHCNLH